MPFPVISTESEIGVEGLEVDLAEGAAVDRVGVFRAEAFDVEEVGAAPDLLVRREAEHDLPVRRLFINHPLDCGDDFRDARFVVRAEKRRSVGHDERLPVVAGEHREILFAHDDSLLRVQRYVAALIFHDACVNVMTGSLGRDVHVRDEADSGRVLTALGRRELGEEIPVFVEVDAGDPERAQLIRESLREHELFGRRRAGFAVLVRRRRI